MEGAENPGVPRLSEWMGRRGTRSAVNGSATVHRMPVGLSLRLPDNVHAGVVAAAHADRRSFAQTVAILCEEALTARARHRADTGRDPSEPDVIPGQTSIDDQAQP